MPTMASSLMSYIAAHAPQPGVKPTSGRFLCGRLAERWTISELKRALRLLRLPTDYVQSLEDEELVPVLAQQLGLENVKELHGIGEALTLGTPEELYRKAQALGFARAQQLGWEALDLQSAGDAALGAGDAATAAEQYAAALARLKEVGHEIQSFDVRAFKATLLSNRAQALLKLERYEEALADAQASLQIQPDNAKAQFRRSMAQSGLEQAQRRRSQGEALKQALFCKTAGNKLLTEGQLEGAIAKYSDGLEWLEDAAGDSACRDVRLALRANRCQGLLRRRRWAEALADADSVLAEDPGHAKAGYRRAVALLELGRREEAEEAVKQLDTKNQEVAELLRRLQSREVVAPAKPAKEEEETATVELVRGRRIVEPKVEEGAEVKRLLKEAEAACARGDFRQMQVCAEGASLHLERQRAEAEERGAIKKVAEQLLSVHLLQARCFLAQKRFEDAGTVARRALQLHRWEEERLDRDFDLSRALRACAPLLETMQSIAEAADALRPGGSVDAGLRCLDRQPLAAAAPLRAALLAQKAALSRAGGAEAEAEAAARRALMIDPSCQAAQAMATPSRQLHKLEAHGPGKYLREAVARACREKDSKAMAAAAQQFLEAGESVGLGHRVFILNRLASGNFRDRHFWRCAGEALAPQLPRLPGDLVGLLAHSFTAASVAPEPLVQAIALRVSEATHQAEGQSRPSDGEAGLEGQAALQLPPVALAQLAQALARWNRPELETSELQSLVIAKLEQMPPQSVGMIANAYARMGRLDRGLLALLSERASKGLPAEEWDHVAVTQLLNAHAKAGIFEERFFKAALDWLFLPNHLASCSPQSLAVALHAFAKFQNDFRGEERSRLQAMFALAGKEVSGRATQFSVQNLVNVVSAFSQLTMKEMSMLRPVLQTLREQRQRWNSQDVANLICALARLSVWDAQTFVAAAEVAAELQFNAQEAASLLNALAHFAKQRPDLADAVRGAFALKVKLATGSDFQLALLLNSVSKVATEGAEELLGEMERRGRVPAEAVGLTFAALARLRHLPPPRLTNALLDRCEEQRLDLARSLGVLIALAHLEVTPRSPVWPWCCGILDRLPELLTARPGPSWNVKALPAALDALCMLNCSLRDRWWRVCVLLLPITAESVAGIRPPSDAELRHCWQALLQLRHLLLGELLHAPLQLLRGMLAIACLPGGSLCGVKLAQR
ncbi:unnamed protein product [Effrenium voratum]|nr:unnamed protein product [Effrenium voratum]